MQVAHGASLKTKEAVVTHRQGGPPKALGAGLCAHKADLGDRSMGPGITAFNVLSSGALLLPPATSPPPQSPWGPSLGCQDNPGEPGLRGWGLSCRPARAAPPRPAASSDLCAYAESTTGACHLPLPAPHAALLHKLFFLLAVNVDPGHQLRLSRTILPPVHKIPPALWCGPHLPLSCRRV